MKKRNTGRLTISVAYIILFFYTTACYSQSYGVGFYSHEVIQDKRSSLDLFPDKPFCSYDDFELSFDMSFLPAHKDYFGYVFRLIKDDNLNIDLVYDHSDPHFSVVVGEKLPKIKFNIDTGSLYKDWHAVKLHFDIKNDRFVFSIGDSIYTQDHIGLKKGNCFKIYFGASQYKQFKITDVPPMKIRDVKLYSAGKLKFNWPLNEITGATSMDVVSKSNCSLLNPVWLKSSHYDWKLNANVVIKGYAAVAFNHEDEILYITGKDSLYNFKTEDAQFSRNVYKSGRQSLLPGNQGVYAGLNNKLYSIYIDQKLAAGLDLAHHKWNKVYQPGPVTDFWQFNKFFSSTDTSIYIIGGYGHYKYRNEIFRYHIPTDSFKSIDASGDRLVPRYLAGLGYNTSGDTAYILGGYGSLTGEQIVNPQNLYDLILFDSKNKKFKKLFDLKKGKEEFVFANSLVVDEKKNTWYGLTFPNYKYNTELQMIKGSITDPSFTTVGSKIPYSFHDINSYSDLFYSAKANKFFAVTMLIDSSEQTQLKIYSLDGPPEVSEVYETAVFATAEKKSNLLYWLLLLPPVVAIVWLFRKKHQPKPPAAIIFETSKQDLQDQVIIQDPERFKGHYERRLRTSNGVHESGAEVPMEPFALLERNGEIYDSPNGMTSEDAASSTTERVKVLTLGSVFLFGEMQIIDKNGVDITKYFTPLIKELFLIILLYTLKKGRGISSEKLNEILWFDKTAQSARNNRSVNIAKLKNILERLGDITLSKDTGYWRIEFKSEEVKLDFQQYLEIVRNKEHLDLRKIAALVEITKAGAFLTNIEYEWLDKFKSEISNEIIDTYLHFAASLNINRDSELLLKIAQYIFNFDPVNEEAMTIKCKAFAHLGKHTLAKNAFDNFAKEYRSIYGEEFSLSFHSVIGV